MRAFVIRTIFLKELRETLRDRRTLFALLVLPVLLHPLLFIFMGSLSAADHEARNAPRPRVEVWGPLPEELVKDFDVIERREVPPPDAESAARADIESKKALLVLVAPPDTRARLAADDGVTVQAFYDSLRNRSDGAHDRFEKALGDWNDATRKARIEERHLPAGFTRPIHQDERNVSSKQREATARIGQVLPLIMLVVMLTCGFLPAADLTAGEKERGTMQTLLCAPVRPIEIVSGKFFAVAVVALLGGAANLAAMSFALARLGAGLDLQIHVGPRLIAGVFVAMIPMALLLSALLLSVAVFARSFREAQSYLTPLMIAILVPAMAAMRPGAELTATNALLPVGNVALLTGAILAGRATAQLFFLVLAVNLAYAAAAMVLAARVFETEQVLLSGESPWRDVFGRADRARVTPSPGEAVLFGAALLVAVFYGSLWLDPERHGLSRTVLLLEGALLLFAVGWTVAGRHSLRETFRLRLPSPRGAAGIVLLAAGGWSVPMLVFLIELKLFPGARQWAEEFTRGFGQLDYATIALIAVTPAIAEEACCRGVLLSGLGNTGSKWIAIGGSALLFGLLHGDLPRIAIAGTLGVVLGFATLESGTIFAGAAIHAVNNFLAASTVRVPRLAPLLTDPRLVALGLLMTAAGAWLVRDSRRR